MDNSPSWDEPLAATPEDSHRHLEPTRRAHGAAAQRPTTAEYRHYLGIVAALRDAGWDTEHQVATARSRWRTRGSPPIAARAADDLAVIAPELGEDAAPLDRARGSAARRARRALGRRPRRLSRVRRPHRDAAVGPATSGGAVAVWAGCRRAACALDRRSGRRWTRDGRPRRAVDRPGGDTFDPIRYWRGPVWVLVNWMVADGLARAGDDDPSRCAGELRADTAGARRPRGLLRVLRPPRRYRHRRRGVLVDGGAHARLARSYVGSTPLRHPALRARLRFVS